MNKKIAVLEDGDGKTSSILKSGIVRIYEKKELKWNIIDEIIFGLESTMDLDMVREKINEMAGNLGDCKVFTASTIGGIIYTIFERLGINAWEISGKAVDYLDYICEKEEEEERERIKLAQGGGVPTPVKKGKFGSYFLDYIKIEERNDKYTTKQVLLPFLKDANFEDLTVICSHVPKWFDNEFANMGLKYTSTENEKHEYKVIIKHKNCCE